MGNLKGALSQSTTYTKMKLAFFPVLLFLSTLLIVLGAEIKQVLLAGKTFKVREWGVTIPCDLCTSSVDFVKDLLSADEQLQEDYIHKKLIGFCDLIGRVGPWLGRQCRTLADEDTAIMMAGILNQHLDAITLCSNMDQLASETDYSPFRIDCIHGKAAIARF